MRKVIETIYHYTDLRLLLNEDYLKRAKENHSYSLRAYARDIEVSAPHLSKFLNRKKTFSFETAQAVLKRIGLWDEDPEFATHLISVDTNPTEETRRQAKDFVKLKSIGHGFLPNPEKDAVLLSLAHFLFYGLVIKTDSLEQIHHFFNCMGWDQQEVDRAGQELKKRGYITIEGGRVEVTDREFFIETHKELYRHHANFNGYILDEIMKKKILDQPDSDGKGAILGLDAETSLELKNHTDHYVRGIYRIANKTKNPDRIVLVATSLVGWETGPHYD